MADIREIITEWTTPSGSDFVTVMYFAGAEDQVTQRAALAAMWADYGTSLSDLWTWFIRNDMRLLNEATGALVGASTDSTAHTDTGDSANEALPEASQLLVRWQTGVIINGRFLQGRTFVPGFIVQASADGEVNPSFIGAYTTTAQDLIDADVGFGIWHRPSAGSGGSFHLATAASVWNEFAVLRGRRG